MNVHVKEISFRIHIFRWKKSKTEAVVSTQSTGRKKISSFCFFHMLALGRRSLSYTVKTRSGILGVQHRCCTNTVSFELIKKLRKETKAGISDCRDALIAGNNDMEKAKTWLNEKAKTTAQKKSSRLAQEGGVLAAVQGSKAVFIEFNCETDFAAKENEFLSGSRNISSAVFDSFSQARDRSQSLLELPCDFEISGIHVSSLGAALQQLTYLFKENVRISRVAFFPSEDVNPETNFLYVYVHSPLDNQSPSLGKFASMVHLSTSVPPTEEQKEQLKKFAHSTLIQIIAGKPTNIENTRPVLKNVDPTGFDAEDEDEPELLQQDSVIENMKMSKLLEKLSKSAGLEVDIVDFARWELNQGEEKKSGDVASDVRSLLEGHKE
eukprot:TRINITY_DN7649_c0_g1_i1.p1 TRINITY_DN7649_c0_g1~~TRINITY_DN7649_c0_g1_i1.p1  ORF type:complete len:380 (-),score=81.86 TRINITY_DN7649_c0_g1_i1:508-1647(-)